MSRQKKAPTAHGSSTPLLLTATIPLRGMDVGGIAARKGTLGSAMLSGIPEKKSWRAQSLVLLLEVVCLSIIMNGLKLTSWA